MCTLLNMKRLELKFLQSYENRTEGSIIANTNIRKAKNVEFLLIQKHTTAVAYMIRLTFVYILYSLYIVRIYKKHTKAVSVS